MKKSVTNDHHLRVNSGMPPKSRYERMIEIHKKGRERREKGRTLELKREKWMRG